ncbi:cutA divalent cation tolerance homolog (E. coli), isoform CRA_d, partial [Mus musculus]
GVLRPCNERPLISSFLYQRGLHELGAGARRLARRRGHSAPVVSLDASATAGGFPPSVATPSSAVNGFWKPSVPAPSGLGLRLRSRISLCSLCHLSQRKSRQGDRQGSGREASGSLRQPHPADHIHVSCQLETEIYPEGLRAFSGRNLPFPRLCSLLSLTSSAMNGKERSRKIVRC